MDGHSVISGMISVGHVTLFVIVLASCDANSFVNYTITFLCVMQLEQYAKLISLSCDIIGASVGTL